jgi:hypothetical protein
LNPVTVTGVDEILFAVHDNVPPVAPYQGSTRPGSEITQNNSQAIPSGKNKKGAGNAPFIM